MSNTTFNVTAEQRALVQRAVAANRAWRDGRQRCTADSEARKRWFIRSQTRDEAIARGAECYLAAIRGADEEPPPPLVDAHIHALRAMVRAGELSPDDAEQIVQLDGGPFDRLCWREALDEEPRRRAFETEMHGRAALDCGRIDADIDDETLTNELLYAWLPSRSHLAQRTILAQIPRPRLGSLLRDCLRLAANDDDALAS
jgi:hypothetical protein